PTPSPRQSVSPWIFEVPRLPGLAIHRVPDHIKDVFGADRSLSDWLLAASPADCASELRDAGLLRGPSTSEGSATVLAALNRLRRVLATAAGCALGGAGLAGGVSAQGRLEPPHVLPPPGLPVGPGAPG